MKNFKVGDKVRLVNLDDLKGESDNWIKKERPDIKLGDEFVVTDLVGTFDNPSYFICLKGFHLVHRGERFELVK